MGHAEGHQLCAKCSYQRDAPTHLSRFSGWVTEASTCTCATPCSATGE